MTVWTQVTLSEVNGWLADHYGLQANRIIPIAEGVEDSVFRLDVGHNDAVFLLSDGSLSLRVHVEIVPLSNVLPWWLPQNAGRRQQLC